MRTPCDQTDKAVCLLPFPNDLFTRADPGTATGRRVDFSALEMPRSIAGKPIDPTEWNRNDGFSPGSMVLTFVPGLDLAASGAPVLTNIGRSLEADSPVLIIDAQTGDRWPFFAELDHNAQTAADQRLLILRPARNFLEGHRYLVALRDVRTASGSVVPASAQFAAYRDGTAGPSDDPTFDESRRSHVSSVIAQIETAERNRGNAFSRSDLFLAWDFTIASERNLSERVLHIRDDAFAQLGDLDLGDGIVQGVSPRFAITSVVDQPGDGTRLRKVYGTITVPNYLDRPPQATPQTIDLPVDTPLGSSLPNQAVPGGRFLYGRNGLPRQNPLIPTIDVPFVCTIPRVASASNPAHAVIYGHGLLGSISESTGGSTDRDRERDFMPCATPWMGFANYDVANAVLTLLDPSNMPSMIDRAQQGFLNAMYLSRALVHPRGLVTNKAFQDDAGTPLFRSGELYYDGNSQGGIMGGALTALSVDLTRSVLGVVGMNYSTLLNRSDDWEGPLFNPDDPGLPSYSSFLYTMFPNKMEQQLVIALLQLWDRGEADGYAQHMTADPLPNTPSHQVLMHVAFGDFQVTNVSAEVEARTIGARFLDTSSPIANQVTGSARYDGFWGIEPFPRAGDGSVAPWNGSAFVYWDSGNLPPPALNVPPAPDGGDPHEDPRRDPNAGDQKAEFWLTGSIVDVMAGGPYLTCNLSAKGSIPRVGSQFTTDWCA